MLFRSTHGHIDHIAALKELKGNLGVPVAIHSLDAKKLPFDPDIELSDSDYLQVGQIKLKVFHTPGHTPEIGRASCRERV